MGADRGSEAGHGLTPVVLSLHRTLARQEGGSVDEPWLGWVVWMTERGWVGRTHLACLRSRGLEVNDRVMTLGETLCGLHVPTVDGDIDAVLYGRNLGVPKPPACRACWYEAGRHGRWIDGGSEPSLA